MTWRRAIATVVLTVLAGWPAAATACAMLCSSKPAQVASHHDMSKGCDESTPAPDPQLSDGSSHDCSTHSPAVRQPATVPGEHITAIAWSAQPLLMLASADFTVTSSTERTSPYASPPGVIPPKLASVVLRI